MAEQYTIYKLTNCVSGKSYVGLTKNLDKRMRDHQKQQSSCVAVRNAIQKHGWQSFSVVVLAEGLSLKTANECEMQSILAHNTLYPHGYNLRTGGQHSKMSDSSKQKLGDAHRGKVVSQATREKIAAARRGKKYDQYLTPEQVVSVRAKQSAALRLRHTQRAISGANHPNARTYHVVSPSGESYTIAGTMEQFCKEHGLTLVAMRNLVNGKRKDYKGWTVNE